MNSEILSEKGEVLPLLFFPEVSLEGLLNINKKRGVASFDVVQKVRKLSGKRKVGHTGILDRAASGVLVVLSGRATKIIRFFSEDDKEYVGTVRLGAATETDDSTGRVVKRAEVRSITVDLISNVLDSFKGEIEQIPPAYSCIKVGGRRLHELAREGTPPAVPARRVQIRDLEMVDFEDGDIKIRVVCSKGTYIRALARDIGDKLGCLGHLHNLVRLRVGENLLKNSIDIDMVSGIEEHLMTMKDALRRFPIVNLGTKDSSSFKFGQMVEFDHPGCGSEARLVRVCDARENLIAVGRIEKGMLIPLRVLA